MTTPFLPTLLDDASRPFRASGHFAYHYARGKLSSDCIFRELLKRGIFPAEARFLDLGCGQGSLFSWLLAARALYEKGVWPGDWAAAPKPLSLRGYELMARDVERAALAFGRPHPIVDIRQGDMRAVDFGAADVVTILDALHYLPHADQDAVIGRIRKALPSGGLFLTRVGDAGAGLPYHICNWVDHAVTFARGHRLPRLFGRKLTEWVGLLESLGFVVHSEPMSDGKPFANTMLVCRVPATSPCL
ncbi:bifunctional 2-polyprenyl-6-hydroxyphenol methylase/3-demethylubiquinol 3-O-methyltransferase UbiG [Accumulibacter sp.]|uniref:class I SAM-dependent methyltransferase n=1 Tax=Accumulibacter sp. TaxID=2053492 RepID=UPI0026384D2B|nr:class I SAM-dependent methyltransferase [Accumulibacter sp.]